MAEAVSGAEAGMEGPDMTGYLATLAEFCEGRAGSSLGLGGAGEGWEPAAGLLDQTQVTNAPSHAGVTVGGCGEVAGDPARRGPRVQEVPHHRGAQGCRPLHSSCSQVSTPP